MAGGMAQAMLSKPGGNLSGGKLGMAAAAAPMLGGMMSGKPNHGQGYGGYGQGYAAPSHGHSSSGGHGGMPSGGTMAAVGAVAAAGIGYYAAMQAKKKNKHGGMGGGLGMLNPKKQKKLAKKAAKYGMTPQQYMGKREAEYNDEMTRMYGPFNGTLPAALLSGKMHKKGKKGKKGKKHGYGGGSSSGSSSSSSGSDSD